VNLVYRVSAAVPGVQWFELIAPWSPAADLVFWPDWERWSMLGSFRLDQVAVNATDDVVEELLGPPDFDAVDAA
jgi:hypothetical protein